MKYHCKPTRRVTVKMQIINVGEDLGKLEPTEIAGANTCENKVLPYCKRVWQFLKMLTIESPYDPTIPLVVKINEHICPHKNFYINGHRSIIHSSQEMQATQLFIN